ncbi:MAG: hypothetical protein J0L96_00475 [Anaerolineae bacterium]|nr:hypothetical protein [Anaerolineae bacterium]
MLEFSLTHPRLILRNTLYLSILATTSIRTALHIIRRAFSSRNFGEVRQFCELQPEGPSLMRAAMSQLNLSACAYHRILKLSRTIADLAGSDESQSAHLAEALQYHPKIMMG